MAWVSPCASMQRPRCARCPPMVDETLPRSPCLQRADERHTVVDALGRTSYTPQPKVPRGISEPRSVGARIPMPWAGFLLGARGRPQPTGAFFHLLCIGRHRTRRQRRRSSVRHDAPRPLRRDKLRPVTASLGGGAPQLSKNIRCFSNRRRLPSSASSSDSAISEGWPVPSPCLTITRWRAIWTANSAI